MKTEQNSPAVAGPVERRVVHHGIDKLITAGFKRLTLDGICETLGLTANRNIVEAHSYLKTMVKNGTLKKEVEGRIGDPKYSNA
jgi:hypothetical protein